MAETTTKEKPTPEEKSGAAAAGTGKYFAHTDLIWSNESEGHAKRYNVLTGEEVNPDNMDDDVFETFESSGAVQTVPRVDNVGDVADVLAAKDARIAELTAALEAAKVPVPESHEPVPEPEPAPEPEAPVAKPKQ